MLHVKRTAFVDTVINLPPVLQQIQCNHIPRVQLCEKLSPPLVKLHCVDFANEK